MPQQLFLSTKNERHMELALAAIAAHPTLQQAADYLLEAHGIRTTAKVLGIHSRHHREHLEEIREQVAPRVEAIRANDMLDNMGLATELERMAMELLMERFKKGWIKDPERVIRDLADVKAKNVDKRLAVQGRPTQIVETRKVGEIVKALEGLGVARTVDATVVEDPLDAGG